LRGFYRAPGLAWLDRYKKSEVARRAVKEHDRGVSAVTDPATGRLGGPAAMQQATGCAAVRCTAMLPQARDLMRLWVLSQLGRRAPTRLILEIEIAERLAGRVPHDEACIVVRLDRPTAAGSGAWE